jgi:hypothetical protein
MVWFQQFGPGLYEDNLTPQTAHARCLSRFWPGRSPYSGRIASLRLLSMLPFSPERARGDAAPRPTGPSL